MWHLTQHRLNKRNFKTDGSKEMSDVIRAIKMSRGGGGKVLNKVLEWEALPEIQLPTHL